MLYLLYKSKGIEQENHYFFNGESNWLTTHVFNLSGSKTIARYIH